MDAISFFTFFTWIGLRKGQGVQYTEEDKGVIARNLGLSMEKIRAMVEKVETTPGP